MSELIEMTARQLDTEVALLRGWKWYCSDRSLDLVFLRLPPLQWSMVWTEVSGPGDKEARLDDVPHFSTDIAAAWPLLQEMQDGTYRPIEHLMAVMGIDTDDCSATTGIGLLLAKMSPLTISQAYYEYRTGHRVTIAQEGNDAG